ncbi:hypothetical protein [Azospirillum sp. ST 5-10]|uniref:hypothetical protein n=1 Tax=unclassified Azospirillum TaxID=2630922 RepID=UPI003F49D7DD
MKARYLLTLLAFVPAPALADAAAADNCAAALPADAKMIYDATRPSIAPGVKIADEIRAATRPLVMGGKLSRSDARPAAEAAGKCLAMIVQ